VATVRGETERKKERKKRRVQFGIKKTTGKKEREFQIKLIDRLV
jgi:hypothetical protein